MEHTFNPSKSMKIQKTKKLVLDIITYVLLAAWALVVLLPFAYMIITSLKQYSEYANEVVPTFFVKNPVFKNYKDAFAETSYLFKYMGYTVIYSVGSTAIMLVVTILASFGFSRLKFRGRNIVFTLFLAMMMIPNELVVITNYYTVVNLGMTNTFTALILPSVLSVFYIYLLRENFMDVGDQIYCAAKVDGTSDWNYLWKVLVPINKPTIISIVILKFIECWNSYVWPRLVTLGVNRKEALYLISNGIQDINNSGFGKNNTPGMMAAVVIVSIPIIVLFIVFRRSIMAGVSKSGTKG